MVLRKCCGCQYIISLSFSMPSEQHLAFKEKLKVFVINPICIRVVLRLQGSTKGTYIAVGKRSRRQRDAARRRLLFAPPSSEVIWILLLHLDKTPYKLLCLKHAETFAVCLHGQQNYTSIWVTVWYHLIQAELD